MVFHDFGKNVLNTKDTILKNINVLHSVLVSTASTVSMLFDLGLFDD